jgi:hypothetical protein
VIPGFGESTLHNRALQCYTLVTFMLKQWYFLNVVKYLGNQQISAIPLRALRVNALWPKAIEHTAFAHTKDSLLLRRLCCLLL